MSIRKTAALLLTIIAFRSSACNCAKITGLADAKAVFTGTVTGIRNLKDSIGLYEIEFKVIKWIKGEQKTAKCTVYEESIDAPGCGIGFEMDAVYQVYVSPGYALREGRLFATSACSETYMVAEKWWMYERDTTRRK